MCIRDRSISFILPQNSYDDEPTHYQKYSHIKDTVTSHQVLCVGTLLSLIHIYAHRLADGGVAGMALIGPAVFDAEQVTVDSDRAVRQTLSLIHIS